MSAKKLITLIVSTAVIGWASTASATDMATVTKNPAQFLDKRIEITAPVVENSTLQKGEFKRWSFTVGGSEHRLMVSEKGFNPATIVKAHGLVEKARQAGDQITIAGKLRESKSGLVVKLDSVRYGDTTIDTDAGPFVEDLYSEGLPWTPLFYNGQKYYPGEFPY